MKTKFIIITTALILSGCTTQKRCYKLFPPRVDSTVSIRETIQYRDTTIYVYVVADTVIVTDTVTIRDGLPESAPVWANVEFARAMAQVRGGKLLLQLFQKDTAIMQLIEDAVKHHSKETVVYVDRQLPPVEVNRLTTWQGFQIWTGRILLAIGLLVVLIKLLDFRRLI